VERKWPHGFATALFAAIATLSGSAYADCGTDMQKLAQDRNVQLQAVNNFAQSFHGKPMDPEQFCVKSAGLIRAESALIAYMEKNKDWCSIPDEAIDQLKEHHAKNQSFNAKACQVAAQIKKMKEQQAQGGGPQVQPLPAGPL
jgi:acid phosphatase class B